MKTFSQFSESLSDERLQLARDRAKKKTNKALARDTKGQATRDRHQELRSTYTNEVYDPEVQGRSQIKKMGDGGRIRPDRKKTEPEKRRMKAAGGGKMVPAKDYKPRKDIGQQRQASDKTQQPQKERGSAEVKQSYADKVKAERRAAAKARAAAKKSGGEVKKDTTSAKDKEKAASKLLSKKTTKTVSPNYKPQKASGYTRQERMKIHRKGETVLRNTFKDQETAKYKKETGQNPDAKGRTKIMGRVHKRMSESYNDPEHFTTYGSGSSPTSGTQGGTTAKFKKRPSTGLAKRAMDSIRNAGKNTAGSQQKPRDTSYRGKGKGRVEVTGKKVTDTVKTAAKSAAQKRLTGSKPKTRPMLGTAQRPDLVKSKPRPQIGGSPQRKALPSGSSGIQKRPESRPKPSSGIQPVKVRVLDDKKLGASKQKALPAAKKQLPAGR